MKFLIPLGLAALFVVAWTSQGWAGIAMVGGGVVMWALLHFTRMLTVLKRAADRPKGWVDSAVMLNAKLRPGVNLLHIMALTRSLGERLSEDGVDPEVFRWTDGGGSSVTCQLVGGKLTSWEMQRPADVDHAAPNPPTDSETS
jgi:hypothetical protein